MKKEFTPGPWRIQGNKNFGYFVQADKLDPRDQADIEILGDDHGGEAYPDIRYNADIRLISVAPDMAHIIEAVLPYLKQCNISGSHVIVETIEDTIKIIEGE